MPQVDITIQGRAYAVQCQVGEEKRAHYLAAHINRHAAQLVARLGSMPDAQLLLMTGMTVADELLEAQERLQQMEQQAEENTQKRVDEADEALAVRIKATSERLKNIAEMLQADVDSQQEDEETENHESNQTASPD